MKYINKKLSREYINKKLLELNLEYRNEYAAEYELVASRLRPGRMQHCLGVAQTASVLAEQYGADPAEAYLAGLCHDIAKELPLAEQSALLKKSPLGQDADVLLHKQLWHAPAGAVLLAELEPQYPRLHKAVQSACLWHTLGRPDMTLLESLIFVADLIEPGRDFPDLPLIREAVWQDLTVGICACMQGVIGFLESEASFVHPLAYEAFNYYKELTEQR